MTVRVANDFKTEAQRELERLVSENKIARDRIRLLEDQMHSLKGNGIGVREIDRDLILRLQILHAFKPCKAVIGEVRTMNFACE